MIFYKYIFKEVVKTEIVVTLILFIVFFSQSLIKFISHGIIGELPAHIVLELALYSVPKISTILIPLSFFISILLTLGRICSDSEMVVLRSIGVSPSKIMYIMLVVATMTALFCAYIVLYISPKALKAQSDLMQEAKTNITFLPIESGRFVNFSNRFDIYIEEVSSDNKEKKISKVYVMQDTFSKNSSLIIAKEGYLKSDEKGVVWLYLNDGERYEGPLFDGTYREAGFKEFRAPIMSTSKIDDDSDIATLSTLELLKSNNLEAQALAQWRIAPIFAIFILTFIAVPLSMVNPRQGRFAKLLPAISLFASYYMLLISINNLLNRAAFPLYPGLYIVPLLFALCVAIPLNLPKKYVHKLSRNKKR